MNMKENGKETPSIEIDLKDIAIATIKTIRLIGRASSFNELARILRADNPEYFRHPSHASLETTGLFADKSRLELRLILGYLLDEEYFELPSLRYQRLEVTPKGEAFYESPHAILVMQDEIRISPFELYFHRYLRDLRTSISEDKSIPPYLVFSDHCIDQIAKHQPETLKELSLITGMDDEKVALYGATIIKTLDQLQLNWHHVKNLTLLSRLRNFTHQEVKRLHQEGFNIEEIAGMVGVKQSTVEQYLCDFHQAGVIDLRPWIKSQMDPEILKTSLKYFKGKEQSKLRDAKLELGYEYRELRFARTYAQGFSPLPAKASA